jgi:hypothetical protein
MDRSTAATEGYQIHHRQLGVFQGTSVGLAFWHPSSSMPEQGLCRFPTREKAESYVAYLTSSACPEPLLSADLSIEVFDQAEHERLISEYPHASAWESPG